ncbi:cytolethal distending toxin subunit B-like [Bradysia coprophila]|uniref:cytolethal distending toxin subunit B-like n=1 Tax=Bradysia coprophila TaxID=38358 RepID=UPI00187DA27E|nr:cytolethal distending toxin subunit B-like [Bradysia coprophila]
MHLLLSAFAILSFTLLCRCQEAFETKTATWNTQGAKWNRVKELLKKYKFDVLALQECGVDQTGGSFLTLIDRHYCRTHPNNCYQNIPKDRFADPGPFVTIIHVGFGQVIPTAIDIFEYEIQAGTGSRGSRYYVYLHELLNARNSRTSLAILSKERAERVILVYEDKVKRPVIGIKIKKKYHFSIHAGAFAANPSHKTVESILKHIKQEHGESFMIMGDFNKVPASNNPPAVTSIEVTKIFPHLPTQRSGSTLDYAFGGINTLKVTPATIRKFQAMTFSATVIQQSWSDHYPVKFEAK